MKCIFPCIYNFLLVIFLAGSVSAASVVYDPFSGEARGISGLSVSGTSYDVSFVSGSYDAVYNVDTPEFFGDNAGAMVAVQEIVAVMLAEPSKPLLSNNTTINQGQVAWVVFDTAIDAFGTPVFQATQAGANFLQPWQVFASFTADRTIDYTVANPGWRFAKFGAPGSLAIPPAVPEVPLPAGGLLLLSGLGIIGLRRWFSLPDSE